MRKRELVWTTGRNVNWCSHCGKQYGGFLELPCDPAILLLGKSLEKSLPLRDIYTPIFFTALFTIAKIMETTYGSFNEWIKKKRKIIYIHIHIYVCVYHNGILLAIKRRKSCHLWQYRWTLNTMQSEISHTEKDKWPHLYVEPRTMETVDCWKPGSVERNG